jgi:hypothetical protein
MSRDRERDALEAKLLTDNELLNHILDGVEADAVARAIYAAPTDHDARQAAAAEARAVRSFRQALQSLAAGTSPRPKRGTPA